MMVLLNPAKQIRRLRICSRGRESRAQPFLLARRSLLSDLPKGTRVVPDERLSIHRFSVVHRVEFLARNGGRGFVQPILPG
jgi:hypothetical protein